MRIQERISSALFLCSTALSFFSGLNADLWQNPVQTFENNANTQAIDLAVNPSGNAVAIWQENNNASAVVSYFSNNAWGPYTILDTGNVSNTVSIAIDDSGRALALWYDIVAGTIRTSYYNPLTNIWTIPTPDPLDTISTFDSTTSKVALNPSGTGVGLWIDRTLSQVRSANFSAGAWSTPTTIGTGTTEPTLAISANGTAVAGWYDVNTTIASVSNFAGGVWTPAVIPGFASSVFQVDIDSSGKAFLASLDALGNVEVRTFNGTTWSSPQVVSTAAGNLQLSLAVARNGNAVLVWVDAGNVGRSSSYNGTTWSAPIQFGTDIFNIPPFDANSSLDVSVDTQGNALVVWSTNSGSLLSSRLPLGVNAWTPASTVVQAFNLPNVSEVISGLADTGRGFSMWNEAGPEESAAYGAFTLFAALDIDGFVCNNSFASQTDRVHIITWTPTTDLAIVSYDLRRNGELIAVIPASGPYIYYDHNRSSRTPDVYTLTGVDALGNETNPISITLQ